MINTFLKLKKAHGKRFDRAWKWITEPDRLTKMTIDDDGTISAIIRGEHGKYGVIVGEKEFYCSCWGSRRWKDRPCSHVLYTIVLALLRGEICEEMLGQYL